MALDQVLATLTGAMQDPDTGLAAKTAALAAEKGFPAGYIRTDVHYEKWMLSGALHGAMQSNLAIAPGSSQMQQLAFVGTARDAQHQVQVSFETFAADPDLIQDTVLTVASAMCQVLDGIEAYSRAHGGTIEALIDPITITFGTFAGPATTAGFTALFTVLERSTR